MVRLVEGLAVALRAGDDGRHSSRGDECRSSSLPPEEVRGVRVTSVMEGKWTATALRVLEVTPHAQAGWVTTVELQPLTGRRHQLRRHCAEVLGAPIVGDSKYGGGDAGSGLYLSAVELRLAHPDRPPGAPPLHVAVEAPAKFGRLLAHEQQRWERLAEPDGDGVVAEC